MADFLFFSKSILYSAESPYRNRSVEDNLNLFRAMKAGRFAEGEVNLRLKQDLYHDDGAMWDTGTKC